VSASTDRTSPGSGNRLHELVADLDGGGMRPVPAGLAEVPAGCLLDVLGMRLTHLGIGRSRVEMPVRDAHLNQRGVPQGGALVALADAAAGWASYGALPAGRFTTLELHCNLLGRVSPGATLVALTSPVHLGRRTLVLDVELLSADQESGPPRRLTARFSCTQMVL
jgi:1,4-dihydroxy-2-naphthoyl-CoA hydrolase